MTQYSGQIYESLENYRHSEQILWKNFVLNFFRSKIIQKSNPSRSTQNDFLIETELTMKILKNTIEIICPNMNL